MFLLELPNNFLTLSFLFHFREFQTISGASENFRSLSFEFRRFLYELFIVIPYSDIKIPRQLFVELWLLISVTTRMRGRIFFPVLLHFSMDLC